MKREREKEGGRAKEKRQESRHGSLWRTGSSVGETYWENEENEPVRPTIRASNERGGKGDEKCARTQATEPTTLAEA